MKTTCPCTVTLQRGAEKGWNNSLHPSFAPGAGFAVLALEVSCSNCRGWWRTPCLREMDAAAPLHLSPEAQWQDLVCIANSLFTLKGAEVRNKEDIRGETVWNGLPAAFTTTSQGLNAVQTASLPLGEQHNPGRGSQALTCHTQRHQGIWIFLKAERVRYKCILFQCDVRLQMTLTFTGFFTAQFPLCSHVYLVSLSETTSTPHSSSWILHCTHRQPLAILNV